jgi:hypothetical protein
LKAEEHGVRGQLPIVEPGIDQTDISPFGGTRADADDIARPLQRVVDIGPFPQMSLTLVWARRCDPSLLTFRRG